MDIQDIIRKRIDFYHSRGEINPYFIEICNLIFQTESKLIWKIRYSQESGKTRRSRENRIRPEFPVDPCLLYECEVGAVFD